MPRLAVYQPDIAPNLGAMIRICACFDAAVDVIEPCGFPFSQRALRRAAMDYLDLAQIYHWASWERYLQDRPAGRLLLLTTAEDAAPLWSARIDATDIFVVGRESAGAPEAVHQAADLRLRIPIASAARSLNVVTAAAIALAEARRQLETGGVSAG